MRRNSALAFFLCFVATPVIAQGRLDGKWATDRPADLASITEAQRRQSVQLEVTIEGANASGTLSLGGLGGTFYTFKDGKLIGNTIEFRADSPPAGPWWSIEMVDVNTAVLSRGYLPLIAKDVMDLLSNMRGAGQPVVPAVPVAADVRGSTGASIGGKVQDPNRALIPGATVKAINDDSGAAFTTITNDSGRFNFPSVTPGKYTITASVWGFPTTIVSNLSIGDTQSLQDLTVELPANPPAGSPRCS